MHRRPNQKFPACLHVIHLGLSSDGAFSHIQITFFCLFVSLSSPRDLAIMHAFVSIVSLVQQRWCLAACTSAQMQIWREHAPSPILLSLALEAVVSQIHGTAQPIFYVLLLLLCVRTEGTRLKVDQGNGYQVVIFHGASPLQRIWLVPQAMSSGDPFQNEFRGDGWLGNHISLIKPLLELICSVLSSCIYICLVSQYMDQDAPITQVYAPMMQFILYFSSISFLLLVSW